MIVDGTGANGLAFVYDEASEQDSLDDNLLRSWPYGVRALGKQNWLKTLRIALRPYGSAPWTAKDCKENFDELLGLLRRRGVQTALVLQSPATPGVRQVHSAWNMLGHHGNPYKWAGTAERRHNLYVCPILHPINYEYVYGWLIDRWIKQAFELAQDKLKPENIEVSITQPGPWMVHILKQFAANECLAVDIETNVAGTVITAIGLADDAYTVSVPWDEYTIAGTNGDIEPGLQTYAEGAEIQSLVLDILSDRKIKKILHNGAFDVLQLAKRNIALHSFTYDTLLLHRVVYPQYRHGLQQACATEFCVEPWKCLFKPPKVSSSEDAWLGDPKALRQYNARDAYFTYILWQSLIEKVGL